MHSMFIQDIKNGLYFKYPLCCIIWYSLRHFFSIEGTWDYAVRDTGIHHKKLSNGKHDTSKQWQPCELCVLRRRAYHCPYCFGTNLLCDGSGKLYTYKNGKYIVVAQK